MVALMNSNWIALGVVGMAAAGTLALRRWQRRTLNTSVVTIGSAVKEPVQVRQFETNGTMSTASVPAVQRGSFVKSSTLAPQTDGTAVQPQRVSRLFLTLPIIILLGLIALVLLLNGDYQIAATLGIVQGLGEFLPISSSAHLIITPWLFGWDDPNSLFNSQTYDVALHVGTLLALIGFFWRDWIQLIRYAPQPRTDDGKLFWLLVLASLPGAAIGFVLDRYAADFFRDRQLIIAGALAIMGVILYYVDRTAPQQDELQHVSWFKALMIGMAQSLAFIPGVSRSGSTMTMGRALGLKRETAARFSFLMAMPITFGAALLKLPDIELEALRSAPFWLGIGISFLVGVLAIGFLLRYLKRNSFAPFVIYRIGFAAVIIVVYLLRG